MTQLQASVAPASTTKESVRDTKMKRKEDNVESTTYDAGKPLLIRLYRGVADHFTLRVCEWIMLWPSFGLWVTLTLYPDIFSKSKSFATMANWADERIWALILGLTFLCRLIALIVNGTFKGFEFSPHIRFGASMVGILVWSQIDAGFVMAFLNEGGLPTAAIIYGLPVILELVNASRSVRDVDANYRSRRK